MKMVKLLLALFLVLVIALCEADVRLVNGWWYRNPPGIVSELTLPVPKPGECVSLEPKQFSNIVNSVQTTDCVKLWDNADCTGTVLELKPPGDAKGEVTTAGLEDKISAIGSCKPAPPPPAPKTKGKKKGKKIVKKTVTTRIG